MATAEVPIPLTKRLFRLLSKAEQEAVVRLIRKGIVVLIDQRETST